MADGERRGRPGEEAPGEAEERSIVFCLLPFDLAPSLHEPLRRHFRDRADVEVVVERRGRERRSGAERRAREGEPPEADDRRRVRSPSGRRVGERRAALVPVDQPPELPRRARRHAERITFVERLEPSSRQAEDLDTARVVTRFQAGDREAFGVLYVRYFERVYGYLKIALRDIHEAEDATQQVFAQVFEALSRYERRSQPFRAWLFTVARNHGIEQLRKQGRLTVMDPAEIDRRAERQGAAAASEEERLADWITDRDLTMLVERLPASQRQVLTMRFMLGMAPGEIAAVLGRTPGDVRKLQSRALVFLRERFAAVRAREATDRRDRPTLRAHRQAPVLRMRRFSLGPGA